MYYKNICHVSQLMPRTFFGYTAYIFINGEPFEIKENAKDLGLLYLSTLIGINKYKTFFLVCAHDYFITHHLISLLYMMIIQRKVDYGLTVWGTCNKTNLNLIQQYQNRCVRFNLQ